MQSKNGNCRHCKQPVVGRAGSLSLGHPVCHRCHIKLLSHGYKKGRHPEE